MPAVGSKIIIKEIEADERKHQRCQILYPCGDDLADHVWLRAFAAFWIGHAIRYEAFGHIHRAGLCLDIHFHDLVQFIGFRRDRLERGLYYR